MSAEQRVPDLVEIGDGIREIARHVVQYGDAQGTMGILSLELALAMAIDTRRQADAAVKQADELHRIRRALEKR